MSEKLDMTQSSYSKYESNKADLNLNFEFAESRGEVGGAVAAWMCGRDVSSVGVKSWLLDVSVPMRDLMRVSRVEQIK